MKLIKWSGLIFCWCLGIGSNAQSAFENLPLSYKYDPYREVHLYHRVLSVKDSLIVFLQADFNQPVTIDNQYHLYYDLRAGYQEPENEVLNTLYFSKNGTGRKGNSYFLEVRLKKPEHDSLMVFHIKRMDQPVHYVFDILLYDPLVKEFPGFILQQKRSSEWPVIKAYVNSGDSLIIRSLDHKAELFFVYSYGDPFEAADPPMNLINKTVSRTLQHDTLFSIRSGEYFTFRDQGLYFIQNDTSGLSGFAVYRADEYFPKLTRMNDIFEPIIYLSTREEIENLKKEEDKKSAFDRYWLNLTRSEEKAKRSIRTYYQRVEESGFFFTCFKPGWKTDMGMIYIMYGPPDEVYCSGDNENWYYSRLNNQTAVSFHFRKLHNVFSPSAYVLIRNNKYKTSWYRKVEAWRKGIQ